MSIFTTYKTSMDAYLLLPELGEASEGYYSAFKTVLAITLLLRLVSVVF